MTTELFNAPTLTAHEHIGFELGWDRRDRLVTAYSTGRGYHDLLHLREVLDRVVELGGGSNPELVLAAFVMILILTR